MLIQKTKTLISLLKNLSLLPNINANLLRMSSTGIGAGPRLEFDYVYVPRARTPCGRAKERIDGIFLKNADRYREHINGIEKFGDRFASIADTGDPNGVQPYWQNDWFEGLDAASLYYFLASRNPKRFFEVGSGNSTKFARRAILDNGLRTKITSIDPHPRAEIDSICDEVIRARCEDVPSVKFDELEAGDVLLVDNGHRSFTGSDVTVFFTEILPSLSPSVLVGVHDIFLPLDYPERWIDRFYNEQYLLLAYFLGGAGDTIELPAQFVGGNLDLTSLPPRLRDGAICWFVSR